ncbi:MAG: hypothetical protein ACRD9W_17690, partial [Terriglobia bacterium]
IQETDKKAGKVVSTDTTTVSADGKTATDEFTDNSGTTPVTGKVTSVRVAKGPAGSHAVSGSWRVKNYDTISDSGLSFTYKVEGDTLSMTDPTGDSYTAKMDGSDAPFLGNPNTTSVSVKKLGANSMQETFKRDGKVRSVNTMTIQPDGKSMKIVIHNKVQGTTMSAMADKQ